MDASKLYFVTEAVKQEIEKLKISTLLSNVITHLQQSISQPNEQTSLQFKNTFEEFKKATHNCPSNDFTLAEKKILSAISGDSMTGIGLFVTVEKILNKNLVTPGEAFANLQKVQSQLTQLSQYLVSVNAAFEGFNIDPDELDENECEIAYLIPREVLDGSLDSFSDEMKRINAFLMTVQEILQEELKSPSIRKFSNSDFQVFLQSTPAVILFVVTILERVIALIKRIAETQKIYKEMAAKKLPASVTEPLKQHISQTISTEMSKLAEKLVKENYKAKDDGRRNELTMKLQKDLKFLAERIDDGAVLEANMGEPEEPSKPKGDDAESDKEYQTAQKEYEDKRKTLERIHSTRLLLEEIRREGNRLLFLTDDQSNETTVTEE